jgi:hypothetical protein
MNAKTLQTATVRRLLPALVLALLILAGCDASVDRTDVAWEASVRPNLICPGDVVRVAWNAGPVDDCVEEEGAGEVPLGAECGDPVRVDISSDPDVFNDAIAPEETTGTRNVFPEDDTTFTFEASDEDDQLATYTYETLVVVPDQQVTLEGTFEGVCSGAFPSWTELALSDDQLRSEDVEILQICNTNTFELRLVLDFGTSVEDYTLGPSRCTEELPGGLRNAWGVPLDPDFGEDASCVEGMEDPPPDFQVNVTVTCDQD